MKSDNGIFEAIKAGINFVSEFAIGNVYSHIEEYVDKLSEKLEKKADRFERRFMNSLTNLTLMLLVFLFLTMSGFFYLIEYQGLSKTLASLIFAGIIFVISLFLRYKYLKEEVEHGK